MHRAAVLACRCVLLLVSRLRTQAHGSAERVLPPTLLATRSRRGVDSLPADCLSLSSCCHTKRGSKPGDCRVKRPGADLGGRPKKRCLQPHQGFQQGHPKHGYSAATREALEVYKARAEAYPILRDVTSAYNYSLDENQKLKASFCCVSLCFPYYT